MNNSELATALISAALAGGNPVLRTWILKSANRKNVVVDFSLNENYV